MHLLLVSATEFEIRTTATWLTQAAVSNNTPKSELLVSGVGQLRTAYALQKKIQLSPPGLVIQAGIGGGHSTEDIGTVYAISSEKTGDLGLMEKSGFSSLFDMGLDEPGHFPYQEGKLMNPYQHLLDWTGLPLIEGNTVNELKSDDTPGFQRNGVPLVESMEGAALHYVCLMEGIPFLQIRSVSNVTGDRDKNRWKLKEAVESLNKSLVYLIQKLETTNETLFRI
jgi:futalosine hydrolase